MSATPPLVLASTSPYRRELLERLGLAFECVSPEVDETARPDESPAALVRRLSEAKARAGAGERSDALVIGSDQVAVIDQTILGKPGSHARALEQLRRLSGRSVTFHTGLCLLDTRNGDCRLDVVDTRVRFRILDDATLERYLQREQPYNCAGSFKSEGLGIALFEAIQGDDPNALIGLPLIRLVSFLRDAGVQVP
ncbi:Maf family protein [Thiohalobacter sp.]|uniref:Maf family protein n=1 Tax=Thiohalobacter sp. TaxID=2025948 RepID=UPI00260DB090|nr:Maf family nucleotide pyrophosphatase [Thiohalobacter sp.]